MKGVVRLPVRDRALAIRKKSVLPRLHGGNRFTQPLTPDRDERPAAPVAPLACLQPIEHTEQEAEAGHVTKKLRGGILASHAADGSELRFFTHQLRAIELVERECVTAFLLSYATGAGKTIIAAGIIACCHLKLQHQRREDQLKVLISMPPVLRPQWKKVLLRWLKLSPTDILEVKRGDDLTRDAIGRAKVVLLTRTLLSDHFQTGFYESPSGWRRKEDTALPAVYAFTYHRLIIDEVHTLKNPKIPWCACHAELAKLCEKRVGMSATLVQSSMSDLAGEAKALGMPARFCDDGAWTGGERGVVNFDTLRAFGEFKDELPAHVLGLPEPVFETVHFRPTWTPEVTDQYNKVLKLGRTIKIAAGESESESEKKLARLSMAVRALQHLVVSPRLVQQNAKALHDSPDLVADVAADDGGALAAMLALLQRIRERDDGGRVIVTAAFTTHLKVLHAYLKVHAPDEHVLYFDADTSDRAGMIDSFLSDDNPRCVLLLSLGAGGTGIDLVVQPDQNRTIEKVGCTTIVFFGARQYAAALETQAVGRINRIGQRRQVYVYHLLVRGGVDEAIGKLQREKEQLSSAVAGDFSAFSSSSGSHRWKQSGGVLRDCWFISGSGAPLIPTAQETRVQRAQDALPEIKKSTTTGRVREVDSAEPMTMSELRGDDSESD